MVDSRFRRRNLQRASLGTRTPCQTRTPNCSSPPAISHGATPTTPACPTWPAACAPVADRANGAWHPPWPTTKATACGAAQRRRTRILVDSQATTARPERGSP